jgi:urease accessory protein
MAMRRATRCERAEHWPAQQAAGSVTLPFDDRYRRRITLRTDAGEDFLLDLAETVVLEEGDGLALDDGDWLAVHAASEPLLEITAHGPEQLARIAWHIGNRHLQAQIDCERILVHDDAVIANMLLGLGAQVRRITAPFSPEGGAYDGHTRDHHHGDGAPDHLHHDGSHHDHHR